MRGRILWAVLITAALVAACSKKDSLYIEPGKAGPATAPKSEASKAGNTTPTAPPKS